MECPNCSFQNAPGSPRCVRCQSCLQFAGVDVVPPRALHGVAGVLQRDLARTRRHATRIVTRFCVALRRPWMRELSWPALAWSVVPGLGQIRHGQRAVGYIILGAWAMLLVCSALMLGTARSWLLVFAAISTHSLAFSLLLAPVLQRISFGRRVLVGFALYAAILGAIYYPVYAAATHTFRVLPVSWVHEHPDLRDGDVLLYTGEWTRPEEWRRGDLVVVRIDARGGGGIVVHGGYAVDRIVGLPGDEVAFRNGKLLINGRPAPPGEQPIRGVRDLTEFSMVARPGEFIILPTALRWNTAPVNRGAVRNAFMSAARVPESNLLGRAFWRARPLARSGRP